MNRDPLNRNDNDDDGENHVNVGGRSEFDPAVRRGLKRGTAATAQPVATSAADAAAAAEAAAQRAATTTATRARRLSPRDRAETDYSAAPLLSEHANDRASRTAAAPTARPAATRNVASMQPAATTNADSTTTATTRAPVRFAPSTQTNANTATSSAPTRQRPSASTQDDSATFDHPFISTADFDAENDGANAASARGTPPNAARQQFDTNWLFNDNNDLDAPAQTTGVAPFVREAAPTTNVTSTPTTASGTQPFVAPFSVNDPAVRVHRTPANPLAPSSRTTSAHTTTASSSGAAPASGGRVPTAYTPPFTATTTTHSGATASTAPSMATTSATAPSASPFVPPTIDAHGRPLAPSRLHPPAAASPLHRRPTAPTAAAITGPTTVDELQQQLVLIDFFPEQADGAKHLYHKHATEANVGYHDIIKPSDFHDQDPEGRYAHQYQLAAGEKKRHSSSAGHLMEETQDGMTVKHRNAPGLAKNSPEYVNGLRQSYFEAIKQLLAKGITTFEIDHADDDTLHTLYVFVEEERRNFPGIAIQLTLTKNGAPFRPALTPHAIQFYQGLYAEFNQRFNAAFQREFNQVMRHNYDKVKGYIENQKRLANLAASVATAATTTAPSAMTTTAPAARPSSSAHTASATRTRGRPDLSSDDDDDAIPPTAKRRGRSGTT